MAVSGMFTQFVRMPASPCEVAGIAGAHLAAASRMGEGVRCEERRGAVRRGRFSERPPMSDRPFYDASVLLDQMLDRQEPSADDVTDLWATTERRQVPACVSAVSCHVIDTIVRARGGARAARWTVRGTGDIFDIIEADVQIIHPAVDSGFSTLDHASQHVSAAPTEVMHLVTPVLTGFWLSAVPVVTPIRTLTAGCTTESALCGHLEAVLMASFSPRRLKHGRLLSRPSSCGPRCGFAGVALP